MRPRVVSDEVLLDSLLSAFAELGFEGASMRALGRHLGVSHNLIYERFGSKEQMWYTAVDHGFEHLVAELADAIAGAGDDGFDRLRAGMLRFIAVTSERPALAQIIHHESARPGPRYDHLFSRYLAPINEGGLDLLHELQAQGRARPGPISAIYFFLTAHGLGAMASHPESFGALGDKDVSPDEVAALAVEMVLDGLRTRES